MRDRWDEHNHNTHADCEYCDCRINLDLEDMKQVTIIVGYNDRTEEIDMVVCGSCAYHMENDPNPFSDTRMSLKEEE